MFPVMCKNKQTSQQPLCIFINSGKITFLYNLLLAYYVNMVKEARYDSGSSAIVPRLIFGELQRSASLDISYKLLLSLLFELIFQNFFNLWIALIAEITQIFLVYLHLSTCS